MFDSNTNPQSLLPFGGGSWQGEPERRRRGTRRWVKSPDQPAAVASSPTSRDAAERIKPTAEGLRAEVLAFLRRQGDHGATDAEIQAGLGMHGNTERPRRRELQEAGLVINSGRRRPTAFGRSATVWSAAEIGEGG